MVFLVRRVSVPHLGLARTKDTIDHSTRRSELNSWIAENEGLAGYSKINTMDPPPYKIVLVVLRPQECIQACLDWLTHTHILTLHGHVLDIGPLLPGYTHTPSTCITKRH